MRSLRLSHRLSALFGAAVLVPMLSSCGEAPGIGKPVAQPLKLADGRTISVEQLEHGREKYMLYCRACHGENGDGRGPAGIGLRPPPRNFTDPAFKFGGVEAGELPPDAELKRIVKGGLAGTAMLPWAVPDKDLDDIIQYIKTFNEVWTEDEPGEPTEIPEDPWKGKDKEALARGSVIYHGLAQCLKCHPAYLDKMGIWNAVKEATGEGSTAAFRTGMYFPDAKQSDTYGHKLLPPDFFRHQVKSGTTPRDLFRTIGSGIGGTAMPMWKGSIPDDDLWALSHYVSSLIAMKDTPEAGKIRMAMLNQPEFVEPTEEGAEGEGAEGEGEGEAPAPEGATPAPAPEGAKPAPAEAPAPAPAE